MRRLLEKLQEIRDALDDDAVFNVLGEVLPSAHMERILRDYYAGKLSDVDLEERLLENVDERRFRAICQTALEGLASKSLTWRCWSSGGPCPGAARGSGNNCPLFP